MHYKFTSAAAKALIIVITSALLSACATPKAVTINGSAAQNVNPDNKGKPLSVVLHVYQLKATDSFSKLTFDDFMSGKTASELIGDSLLADKEVILVPGGTASVSDTVKPEAHFVGIIGFFRKPDPHLWRLLLNADDVRSKGLDITAEECFLKANNLKPMAIPGQPAGYMASCQEPAQTAKQAARQEEKHDIYLKKYKYHNKEATSKNKTQ